MGPHIVACVGCHTMIWDPKMVTLTRNGDSQLKTKMLCPVCRDAQECVVIIKSLEDVRRL
jgi:hypothetical protein